MFVRIAAVLALLAPAPLIAQPAWAARSMCPLSPGNVTAAIPDYAVSVTPDGQAVTWPANTTQTSSFTVTNEGSCIDRYTYSCSVSGTLSSCSVNPASPYGGTVTATYPVGAPGSGVVTLTASGASHAVDDGSFNVTVVPPYGVAVTPDGWSTQTHLANTGGYSETFWIHNTGYYTDTFGISCSGAVNVTCTGTSAASVPLDYDAYAVVTATYGVGSAGTGTLTLTASAPGHSSDAGSYTVPVVAHWLPIVSLAPYHGDSRRVGDFDGTFAHATPPYFSLGAARSLALAYNSSTVRPTATISVDVSNVSGGPYPTAYGVQVALASSGATLTLLNGSPTVYYTAGTTTTSRLVAALDAKSNRLATGWYDVNVTVTSYYSDGSASTTLPTRFLVDDESHSLFGAGWNVAGLERLYAQPGSYSALITGGDGSMSFFRRDCATCAFVSPAGDPSTLSAVTDPQKGSIYRRTALDGSYVDFTGDGRMWRAVVPYQTTTVLTLGWTDTLLTSIQDRVGKRLTLGYTGGASASGKLQTVTDAGGRVTTYWTDAAEKLYKITDPDGAATQFAYNGLLQLATIIDRAGAATDLRYDPLNQLDTVQAPVMQDYTGASVRPTVALTSPDRVVWQPQTPGTSLSAPKANVQPASVMATVVDPVGATTQMAFDRFGLATRVVDPLGLTTIISRDTLGQVLSDTEPNGHIVTNSYTGYLLTQTYDNFTNRASVFAYSNANRLITIFDATRTDIYYYPGNGPIDSVYSGNQGSYESPTRGVVLSRHFLNQWGLDSVVVDGAGHATTVLYGDTALFANPVQMTDPFGRIVAKLHHDLFGRPDTTWTPSNGSLVASVGSYDPLNRITSSKDPLGQTTLYGYGPTALLRVTDPKGQVYKLARNGLGQVIAKADLADTTKADTLKYDVGGRLRTIRTRRGDTITLTYDAVGRLLTRSGPDFPTDAFRYDPLGRWMIATNANAYDSVSFDLAGRPQSSLERLTGGSSYTMSYGFDTYNRPTWRDGPPGGTSRLYNYDATRGVVNKICAAAGCVFPTNVDQDNIPHEQRYTDSLFNQAWSQVDTTDQDHRETGNGFLTNTGTPINLNPSFQATWQYDTVGRVVSRTLSSGARTQFTYDALGQLLNACNGVGTCVNEYGQSNGVPAYRYDPAGNRSDTTAAAVIGAGNRVTSFKGYVLAYDANGSVLSKRGTSSRFGTDTSQFTWDALGRLTSVTTWPAGGAHTTVTFTYDALGRRVSKTVNGVTERYVHEGDQVVLDINGTTQAVKAEYGYRPGLDNLAFLRTPSWTAAAITDLQNGTLRGLVQPIPGAPIKKQYTPSAWGETAADTGTVVRVRLAGREYDQETRLYYNRARYYDPQLGRFLSEDPIGIDGGLNLYAYAGNDPVNASDPTGLTCQRVVEYQYFQDQLTGAIRDWHITNIFYEGCDRWGLQRRYVVGGRAMVFGDGDPQPTAGDDPGGSWRGAASRKLGQQGPSCPPDAAKLSSLGWSWTVVTGVGFVEGDGPYATTAGEGGQYVTYARAYGAGVGLTFDATLKATRASFEGHSRGLCGGFVLFGCLTKNPGGWTLSGSWGLGLKAGAFWVESETILNRVVQPARCK